MIIEKPKPHILSVNPGNNNQPLFGDSHLFHPGFHKFGSSRHLFFNISTLRCGAKSVDEEVFAYCNSHDVDAILIVPQPVPEFVCSLRFIRELTVPMVVVWWDAAVYSHLVEVMSDYCLNIIIDDQNYKGRRPDRNVPMWTPVPHVCPEVVKDIGVSFIGDIESCTERRRYIKHLLSSNVPVFCAGNRDWNRLEWHSMWNILSRTKIILNFSKCRFNDRHQLKGRALEAMSARAMLLETVNDQTPTRFEPMVDYVPFSDENDLIQKVQFYLQNDSERLRIANNGATKWRERYSMEMWWKEVMKRLFTKVTML